MALLHVSRCEIPSAGSKRHGEMEEKEILPLSSFSFFRGTAHLEIF